jgi:hypothetical protein
MSSKAGAGGSVTAPNRHAKFIAETRLSDNTAKA